VRGNDDATLLSLSRDLGHDVPHESLSLRVNTSRRLIKEDQWRIAEHCHRHRELSLVSTRELVGLHVDIVTQVHIIDLLLDDSLSNVLPDSLQ
jgi:hypothetical protein